MPSLRDIQRGFARAVMLGNSDDIAEHIVSDGVLPAHRLAIHRNTARAGMTAALRLVYPAVDRLVGADFFDMAAARFIRRHPPASTCLDDYGAAFADFLPAIPECAELRYLADVARFEWALGVAAHAPDVPAIDLLVLADRQPSLHHSLCLRPHPSVTLLCLAYPADHIADAVQSGDPSAMASIDIGSGPIHLAVHRGPNGVAAERMSPSCHAFLSRLYSGEPLDDLLEQTSLNAAEILARQFIEGRIVAVSETPI